MSIDQGVGNEDYVIQRASETVCEWWTGSRWTENWDKARRYSAEPDAGTETGDESAKVQRCENANVTQSEASKN